eukprot:SAG31_NODE_714_length_12645_cov_15.347760_2_plen_72_part_00
MSLLIEPQFTFQTFYCSKTLPIRHESISFVGLQQWQMQGWQIRSLNLHLIYYFQSQLSVKRAQRFFEQRVP